MDLDMRKIPERRIAGEESGRLSAGSLSFPDIAESGIIGSIGHRFSGPMILSERFESIPDPLHIFAPDIDRCFRIERSLILPIRGCHPFPGCRHELHQSFCSDPRNRFGFEIALRHGSCLNPARRYIESEPKYCTVFKPSIVSTNPIKRSLNATQDA